MDPETATPATRTPTNRRMPVSSRNVNDRLNMAARSDMDGC
jgi:hypothetical protein